MASSQSLNMSSLPPVYILPTHLQTEDLHEAEDALYHTGGRLTYRATEARVFLGKILHKKRAAFDLRARGLWTQEERLPDAEPASKQRKLDRNESDETESPSESEGVDERAGSGSKRKRSSGKLNRMLPDLSNHIVVLRLEWLEACSNADQILPFEPYLVYSGKIVEKPANEKSPPPINDGITYIKAIPESQNQPSIPIKPRDPTAKISSILERAKAEAASNPSQSQSMPFHRRKFGQKTTSPTLSYSSHPPRLYRATTSEMEDTNSSKLPPVPSWLIEKHPRPMYSCLRSTASIDTNPNRHFIAQLTKIKEARLLTLDEIGVRAYSTSIASLAAYPHRITSPLEISRLPGCNDKIAGLWIDWHESVTHSEASTPPSSNTNNDPSPSESDADALLDPQRTIPVVNDLTTDPDLTHLRTFHQIWGVGAETARKFYLTHGWKDIDDVVEFGWNSLTRVQQIGVKFYDEFQCTIPRPEVEEIARTVLKHARLCKGVDERHWTNDVVDGRNGADKSCLGDPRDFVAVIVGGYRRGKAQSGDVDVILSHRDEGMTKDLVVDVVQSLEGEGWVTHTLTLHTTSSDRGQQTLPYRSDGGGHGFDSLDKALCVWQDPHFEPAGKAGSDGAADVAGRRNPNVHRRVDIIVSAWRTVGCAVLGWSGGTTFQRDIRRWVKRERGWKFDSSGVRDRGNGLVLELEGPTTVTTTTDEAGDGGEDRVDGWEDRERRLMEGLGIGWRPATERCTG